MTRVFRRSTIIWAVLIACAGALVWFTALPGAHASEPSIPAGAGLSSWYANGAQGRYVLEVIDGHLSAAAKQGLHGTVMTDANCAPDAQGLNHCHNLIVLDNGARLMVVNHHQMTHHHCLRPGESIMIAPLAAHWATLQTLD